MRARIEARSFTPQCQPPNKQLQRIVTRNRERARRPLIVSFRRLSGVCLVSIDRRTICHTARSVTLKFQR